MMSTLFISLEQRIKDLTSYLISSKDDLECGPEDHVRSVAFKILASAAFEEFVEERCKEVARAGIDRLRRGQSTATGRALVVWHTSRNNPGHIPIHDADVLDHFGEYDEVLDAYLKSVSGNHGINGKDLARLINPVGIRSHQAPAGLIDKVDALAAQRDPVVHSSIKRAHTVNAPSLQRAQVEEVLALLGILDKELDVALATYPLRPT